MHSLKTATSHALIGCTVFLICLVLLPILIPVGMYLAAPALIVAILIWSQHVGTTLKYRRINHLASQLVLEIYDELSDISRKRLADQHSKLKQVVEDETDAAQRSVS